MWASCFPSFFWSAVNLILKEYLTSNGKFKQKLRLFLGALAIQRAFAYPFLTLTIWEGWTGYACSLFDCELSELFTQPAVAAAGLKALDNQPHVPSFPTPESVSSLVRIQSDCNDFLLSQEGRNKNIFMTKRKVYITLGLTTECFLCKSD